MATQTLEILRNYMTCEDEAVRNKYYNLLDSFWHKYNGEILVKIVETTEQIELQFTNNNNVVIPKLPDLDIDFLNDLEAKLDEKVDKVPGKSLTSNDFTNELKQKLDALQNYVHPELHQISEIEDLPEVLAGKVDVETGKALSSNDYTNAEKAKLAAVDVAHYGAPLQSVAELEALPEDTITDKERRYVEDEISDYFYDQTATAGDVAPTDQTNATGFWKKVAVGGETGPSIKTKYESNPDTNAFTNAHQTKLNGLRTNAENETLFGQKGGYQGTLQDLKSLIDAIQTFSGNYEDLTNKPTANYTALNAQAEIDLTNPFGNFLNYRHTDTPTTYFNFPITAIKQDGRVIIRTKQNSSFDPSNINIDGTAVGATGTLRGSVEDWFNERDMLILIQADTDTHFYYEFQQF